MTFNMSISLPRPGFELAIDLQLQPREITVVLGPNGAGKSSWLRAIAGLESPAAGDIVLDGMVLSRGAEELVAVQDRSVGFVFQDHALFAWMTVLENVSFGPLAKGASHADAQAIATTWLERLGIPELAGRSASELSGGEAQVVAIARALAAKPRVLLLDEPLAALDVDTKSNLRAVLHRVLRSFEGYVLLVTHDQTDALVLADRLLVMEQGRISQDGTPEQLAAAPASTYVASVMNVIRLSGTLDAGVVQVLGGGELHVATTDLSGEVVCVIRPESIALFAQPPAGSPRNHWLGRVGRIDRSPSTARVWLETTPPLQAVVTNSALAELGLTVGQAVWAILKAVDVAVHPHQL